MSDQLESLAKGLGGGGGGASGQYSSASAASSGAPITADTNINFGSGSLYDTPTITAQQNPSATSSNSQPGIAPNQPLGSGQQGFAQPVTSAANPNTKLFLYGGIGLAVVAVFLIIE